jgi:hypothetical protein
MYKSVHETIELTAAATDTQPATVAPLSGAVINTALAPPLSTLTLTKAEPMTAPLAANAVAEIV